VTSVFIGGSRAISKLNGALRAKLDDLMQRGCTIFVGDASGADKVVQQHFAARGYPHVVVYCMDGCRNNIGGWPTKKISRPAGPRDFAYYATKDKAMADDAKCGMMLWDGESKGTLNNIQNLLAAGKKTLVYFSPENAFYKLVSSDDLDALILRCDQESIAAAQRRIAKAANDPQLILAARPS
jgi:hypothetical protein